MPSGRLNVFYDLSTHPIDSPGGDPSVLVPRNMITTRNLFSYLFDGTVKSRISCFNVIPAKAGID
jgi:hypothetical protein